MAATQSQVPVLVVGAGPVGLTLALELARRGIRCTVVEREEGPLELPRMERCNARTMEIYRRLGLAERIRQNGFPPEASMDVCVLRSLAEEPLVRLRYPSVAGARELIAATNDGTEPLEPYQVVSQYTLEPLLGAAAQDSEMIDLRFGCALTAFEQDGAGVTAQLTTGDGAQEAVRAGYLVGCDGGRSTVRKALGIKLEGEGSIASKNQVFFRSENLFELCPFDQGRMYFFTNEDESILVVQDDLRHFSFHTSCWGDEEEQRKLIHDTIGLPIDIEILASTGWNLHLLVAEQYQRDRVLLAGDAVHLVIPAGGLGLNTGVGDAVDLAWKLAATIQGWGGPELLPSYEAERLPIGRRNRDASGYATRGQMAWRAAVRPYLDEDTPEGRGTRQAVVRVASSEQRKTHEMVGTELGYRYEQSPVVWHEPGPWPPDVPEVYVPTARPGARLPHVWLSDGTALHDHLGDGFTLLRLGPDAPDVGPLLTALQRHGAPVEVLDLDEPAVRAICRDGAVLVRPDLHVAWRGEDPGEDADAVAQLVTGHAGAEPPTN